MPGPASVEEMGAKVDYQVAAPAETGTPNLHRAKIAHKRVRMEGWRQRRLGAKTRNSQGGRRKIDLTLTGLLMEGIWITSGFTVIHATAKLTKADYFVGDGRLVLP